MNNALSSKTILYPWSSRLDIMRLLDFIFWRWGPESIIELLYCSTIRVSCKVATLVVKSVRLPVPELKNEWFLLMLFWYAFILIVCLESVFGEILYASSSISNNCFLDGEEISLFLYLRLYEAVIGLLLLIYYIIILGILAGSASSGWPQFCWWPMVEIKDERRKVRSCLFLISLINN